MGRVVLDDRVVRCAKPHPWIGGFTSIERDWEGANSMVLRDHHLRHKTQGSYDPGPTSQAMTTSSQSAFNSSGASIPSIQLIPQPTRTINYSASASWPSCVSALYSWKDKSPLCLHSWHLTGSRIPPGQ